MSDALYYESPEITGDWRCSCGNVETFVGYDDVGSPGDDCDCGASDDETGLTLCTCEVTLSQVVRIVDGEPTYDAHEGGGDGAEIGQYTRIECAVCCLLLYVDSGACAGPDGVP